MFSRYLLVKGNKATTEVEKSTTKIPSVEIDPAHPVTLSGQQAHIPQSSYRLEKLLASRRSEYIDDDPDDEDIAIFEAVDIQSGSSPTKSADAHAYVQSDCPPKKANNDWKHNAKWVNDNTGNLMPPPSESTPSAAMAVQRELRAMLKEQEAATCLKELGWYMAPELIGDNLFQWIVELHSLDKELPIAKDMQSK
jgi:ubiquitin-conjugating enzyme E2 Q